MEAPQPVRPSDKLLPSKEVTGLLNSLIDELKCSVCFELFREPRSLPCTHSFCTECLCTLGMCLSSSSFKYFFELSRRLRCFSRSTLFDDFLCVILRPSSSFITRGFVSACLGNDEKSLLFLYIVFSPHHFISYFRNNVFFSNSASIKFRILHSLPRLFH
jgi:hypothetical protein